MDCYIINDGRRSSRFSQSFGGVTATVKNLDGTALWGPYDNCNLATTVRELRSDLSKRLGKSADILDISCLKTKVRHATKKKFVIVDDSKTLGSIERENNEIILYPGSISEGAKKLISIERIGDVREWHEFDADVTVEGVKQFISERFGLKYSDQLLFCHDKLVLEYEKLVPANAHYRVSAIKSIIIHTASRDKDVEIEVQLKTLNVKWKKIKENIAKRLNLKSNQIHFTAGGDVFFDDNSTPSRDKIGFGSHIEMIRITRTV